MSYKLDIHDNGLFIQGLFGQYLAEDYGNGYFSVSVERDECVNELDPDGEEYLIEAGHEWTIPVKSLTELNSLIKKCEDERLWNYMLGPVFKIKIDYENSLIYLRGHTVNFIIGECEKGLYVDDMQNSKTHCIMENLLDGMKSIMSKNKWWDRSVSESIDIVRNSNYYARITDGGNLKIEIKDKNYVIGQKEDGEFWINVSADQERHVYYKSSLKEVINILIK